MEKFRSKLWTRIICYAMAIFVSSGVFFSGMFGVFDKFKPKEEYFADFMSGFQAGIYFVIMLTAVYCIAKYLTALGNDEKLKKVYICETDERKIAINEKAGLHLFIAVAYVMLVATLVAGYFNVTVFFTILICLFVVELVFTGMKIYYSKTM